MTPLPLLDAGSQKSGTTTTNPGETAPSGDGSFAELVDGPASQDDPPAQVADETAAEAQTAPDAEDTIPEPAMGLIEVDVPVNKPTVPTTGEVAKVAVTKSPKITKEPTLSLDEPDAVVDDKPVDARFETKLIKGETPAKGAVPAQTAVQAIVESRMPREQAKTAMLPAEEISALPAPDAAEIELESRLPTTIKVPQQTVEMQVQRPQMPVAEQKTPIETSIKVEKNGERQTAISDVIQPDIDVPKPPTPPTTPSVVTAVSTGAPTAMLDLQRQATNKALAEIEVVAAQGASERSGPTSTHTVTAATTAMPTQIGQQVAHQIAVAMTQQGGRATEIALNPEELGRVRLSMTAQETTITLNVLAERPETTDLLRRNIDALEQEFRAMGYDNINFSFGRDGDGQTDGDDAPDVDAQDVDILDETTTPTALQPSSGLDLRM